MQCSRKKRLFSSNKKTTVFCNTYINVVLKSLTTNQVHVILFAWLFLFRMHQRHGTLSGNSIRRKTLERKPSKGSLVERPSWSLFSRVNEGSETILFREKFADWPEPGRIIKMRGHESSGELVKVSKSCICNALYHCTCNSSEILHYKFLTEGILN